MAGLARGFQTGFGLADSVARQDEDRRRYEQQQARLDAQTAEESRRYGLQQERLDRQEGRQIALHDLQVDQLQFDKSRRGILAKQQDEAFKTSQDVAQLNMDNVKLQMKELRKEMQMKDIGDIYSIMNEEIENTGEVSLDTYQKAAAISQGTPFALDKVNDQQYIKDVDYLNDVAKFGFDKADPAQLMNSFNNVFKDEINKQMIADGAAYNRITNAEMFKDGSMNFEITAYDNNGNKLESRFVGKQVPFKNLVDSVFARKAIVGSMIAHPEFKAKLDYARTKWSNVKNDKYGYNNVQYAQTLYRDILDDAEKNKRALISKEDPLQSQEDLQGKIDQIDQETKAKIATLYTMFSPQELTMARIPQAAVPQATTGADAQESGQQSKEQIAIEALKARGLLRE
ncbi:hypothetical protein [Vibrio jasicida]|uniref:hypothetical protein n=1 Tax=Vibrio jasicida TaxID=766224 RepID=UPI0005EF7272|nr:hypothetical protein [Vibrio jasicida]